MATKTSSTTSERIGALEQRVAELEQEFGDRLDEFEASMRRRVRLAEENSWAALEAARSARDRAQEAADDVAEPPKGPDA